MLVSNAHVLEHLDLRPFGLDIPAYDFTADEGPGWNLCTLLQLYNRMNGLAFGPGGMPMPTWVMVDLALLPSALMLIALPQPRLADLSQASGTPQRRRDALLALLEEARRCGHTGPIPVAGYCASPSGAPGRWVGWSLSSVLDGHGLGTVVKALAVRAYRARFLDGVTQYANPALRIHSRFGPMRIRAASVPLHTTPGSFVYETDLEAFQSSTVGFPGGVGAEQATFLLDPADLGRQQQMHRAIVDGTRRFTIIPPGIVSVDGQSMVPINETTPAATERRGT